jgi:hypothetical protein
VDSIKLAISFIISFMVPFYKMTNFFHSSCKELKTSPLIIMTNV